MTDPKDFTAEDSGALVECGFELWLYERDRFWRFGDPSGLSYDELSKRGPVVQVTTVPVSKETV